MDAHEHLNAGTGPSPTGESPRVRINRNWAELLQELRVTQTGVQLLTGFLLTLPFQGRFDALDDVQRGVFLATVSSGVLATVFLVAPVSHHRAVFRRQEKDWLVAVAQRLALIGLAVLGVTILGVVWLVWSVVLSSLVATIVTSVVAALLVGLWWVLPLVITHPPGSA